MGELAILRGDKKYEVYNRDNENIIKRLSYCCNKKPDLEIFKGEDRLTYREFWKNINDFASFLQEIETFDREDPVVLSLHGRASRYIALYGVLASGGDLAGRTQCDGAGSGQVTAARQSVACVDGGG